MGVQLDKGISGSLTEKNSAPWCMYQVRGLPALWQISSGSGRGAVGVLSGQSRSPGVRFWAAGGAAGRQARLPRYLRGADVRCRSVVRNTVRFFSSAARTVHGWIGRDWLGGAWGFAGVRPQESHGVACSWGFVVEH
jgi:hypothetical protein